MFLNNTCHDYQFWQLRLPESDFGTRNNRVLPIVLGGFAPCFCWVKWILAKIGMRLANSDC